MRQTLNQCPTFQPPDDRHQEQQPHDHAGDDDRAVDLGRGRRRRELEELEQEQEVPLGAGGAVGLGRVGGGRQLGAECVGSRKPPVPWPNLMHSSSTTASTARQATASCSTWSGQKSYPACCRGSLAVMPCRRKTYTCAADEADQQDRQHAGVQREEARQRVVAVVRRRRRRAAGGRSPTTGTIAIDVGGDLGGPVALLVPRQQVAGERQAQHDVQQDQAEPEVDLARRAVGAVDDTCIRCSASRTIIACAVKWWMPAQQPAAPHLVLDVVDALPGGLRAGAVGHPQEHAGDRSGRRRRRRACCPRRSASARRRGSCS